MVPEVPARPLRLQAVGEKPGEGNPADPGQARMQVSIHVKVVGLALVQGGTSQPICPCGQHLIP
jgi:hypothetical protein